MKFATKPIRQYPPHLRLVATRIHELKAVNLKFNLFAFSSVCTKHLLKFGLIFQGSVAIGLR